MSPVQRRTRIELRHGPFGQTKEQERQRLAANYVPTPVLSKVLVKRKRGREEGGVAVHSAAQCIPPYQRTDSYGQGPNRQTGRWASQGRVRDCLHPGLCTLRGDDAEWWWWWCWPCWEAVLAMHHLRLVHVQMRKWSQTRDVTCISRRSRDGIMGVASRWSLELSPCALGSPPRPEALLGPCLRRAKARSCQR
jgi:hypothetical protein